MRVTVAFKLRATGRADEMIDSLAIHGFRMFRPPSHTALVGAKAFLFRTLRTSERTSAGFTNASGDDPFLLYRNADVISTAVGLDGVFGYAEISGDSGIAVAFAAQVFNPLFLSSSHMFSSVSEGK